MTINQLNKVKAVAKYGMEPFGIVKRRFWHFLWMIIHVDYDRYNIFGNNILEVISNFSTCCICDNRVYSNAYIWSEGPAVYNTSVWSAAYAFHLECLFDETIEGKGLRDMINNYIDTAFLEVEFEERYRREDKQEQKVKRSEIKKIREEIKRVMKEGI